MDTQKDDTLQPIQFKRGLWRETAHQYVKNKWLVVLVIAASIAVYAFSRPDSNTGTTMSFAWAFLALCVHNSVLNDVSGFAVSGRLMFSFFWRSLVLVIAPTIVTSVVTIAVLRRYDIDLDKDVFILLFMSFFGAAFVLMLALAGTWLPAAVVDGGDRRLSSAIHRCRHVFGYTLLRLIGCCGLIGVATIGILVILLDLLGDPELIEQSKLTGIGWTFSAIFLTMYAFMIVLMAVVLSRAYLIAEDRNINDQSKA